MSYAHVHTHMHTHPTSFSPTFLGTSIDWVFFLPKPKKKKTNPVETHFLAKLQPTKGKQAGVSPDYRPNHQSARLPGQQRKDTVRGTVLADPVSTASGARSLRVQASCLERQPLSPDQPLCIIKMTSQGYYCSGLSMSAAHQSATPGGLFWKPAFYCESQIYIYQQSWNVKGITRSLESTGGSLIWSRKPHLHMPFRNGCSLFPGFWLPFIF